MKALQRILALLLGISVIGILLFMIFSTRAHQSGEMTVATDRQGTYPGPGEGIPQQRPVQQPDTQPQPQPFATQIPAAVELTPPLTSTALPATVQSPPPTIQTPILEITEPLPAGTKFVFGETDNDGGKTTIWVAPATNPSQRKRLTTLQHKAGYAPQGIVSPDGSQLAYTVIPPETPEQHTRTDGAELWVMNVDGTNVRKLADRQGYLIAWARDNHAVTVGSFVALDTPTDPQVPFRTDIHVVPTDGKASELLLSDDTAYGIQPLGWSSDSRAFYYIRITLQGTWEVWRADYDTKQPQLQTTLPASPQIQSVALSPTSDTLLVSLQEGDQSILYTMHVDGTARTNVVNKPRATDGADRVLATWSADGTSILAHLPTQAGDVVRFDLKAGQHQSVRIASVNSNEFFIPHSWSPKGEWLTVLKYPNTQSQVYLLNTTRGSAVPVPLLANSQWLSVFGWTER